MAVISRRARRPGAWSGPVLALAMTAGLAPFGPAPRADEPKPAPSPAPQDNPAASQGASGAAAGQGNQAAPAAPEGKTGRGVFGTIIGAVFDPRKKPLVGWMVQLSSRGDDGVLRVTGTNEKGQYAFKDLPAGTYDIEVQAENEAARKKGPIEVKPPFRNIVDFQIGPQQAEKPNPLATLGAEARKRAEAGGGSAQGGPGGPAGGAARQVPVRGTFVDAQKRPVSEVAVTFVALEAKGIFQVLSGDDGSFAIPAVPPGRYRALVFSPGYVPIDLKSVEVSPETGLNLSLCLVDYPLNTKERPEDRLPREEPLPAPTPSPTSQPS